MITIIDYGMGNLKSVQKAFTKVGIDSLISSKPSDIDNASAVVLPGVGAFRDCVSNLGKLGLADSIYRAIEQGKPYLGICLGLQILFGESEEFGASSGLGFFEGSVIRFRGNGLKIPHMGWNNVKLKKRPPLFNNIEDNGYFYFVHSYYVKPDDPSIITGITTYGAEFTSMIWKDNIVATQFHPEKSQRLGLKILKNFGEFVKKA
ncbi:imidazole glycerol phosphate synthase subunit HisH 1 [bacterium BMS3Abin07]|nr:imidazole glycerol phosphate synthase subunit HisH 1 [bacterium BMS3Abin07]HDL21097.1 imidazole glycerol phosphate synthase subunit HisH [Nitrospirota bacterium]HDO21955.1 imidazole glycerol phosphate synthase subunit HisH [Nitrospirota bacterium]HDZ87922.1 imidazole glycerol phosphate synthase subunit HisH [Nitrospirota bacterium]